VLGSIFFSSILLLDVPVFCVDVKQFMCLKLRTEAISIGRRLVVCDHSLTVELMQIDDALLLVGFGIFRGK
jgi:ABC-type cobalamin transport system ATPase subunit